MLCMGVIGYGYWGPNVARNFGSVDGVNIVSISDKIPDALKRALQETAEKKFMSMAGYIKFACEKALQEDGVDWRKEPPKAPPKKK